MNTAYTADATPKDLIDCDQRKINCPLNIVRPKYCEII